MSQKGMAMRNVREVLRLRLGLGRSTREVARSCSVSHSTVLEYARRAREAGLTWPLPEELDDTALARLVCEPVQPGTTQRPLPEIAYLAQEMRKLHA